MGWNVAVLKRAPVIVFISIEMCEKVVRRKSLQKEPRFDSLMSGAQTKMPLGRLILRLIKIRPPHKQTSH